MEAQVIDVINAKEHNLCGISLQVPRNKLTVFTGLSGSGKSSLAFDTIYVEGQRRYVESLSAYARQFLDMMQKPEVERIDGLPPTIAIEQRKGQGNPRSTVATTTEIYDYLRLLYARVGEPYCWRCGKPISHLTPQQIVDIIIASGAGKRAMLLAPVVRGRKGSHREVLNTLRRSGYIRARIDGELVETRNVPELEEKTKAHTIEAVVDRLKLSPESRQRVAESVENALGLANGLVVASIEEIDPKTQHSSWHNTTYSENFGCLDCDVSFEEMEPRMFSFNSPFGACPACDGLGTRLEIDPDLLIPNPALSLEDGAVELIKVAKRWAIQYHALLRDFARSFGVSMATPIKDFSSELRQALIYGCEATADHPAFVGLIPNLTERFENSESEMIKTRIHEFMSVQPCPSCGGARLKPEALAVKIAGMSIRDFCAHDTRRALEIIQNLHFDAENAVIAAPIIREVERRLTFMNDVGLGYLTLDRITGTLSGGEHQRIRLASQVGSGLVGVCYVLDEPTIGLHQRDNDRLLETLKKLRDLGNTVIVVEHDEDIIRAADFLVDIGPGAGIQGGRIMASGTVQEVMDNPASLTGKYLSGIEYIPLPTTRRPAKLRSKSIRLEGACENNLKVVNAVFPLGTLICVTGVSGSGKSTLVTETLCKALKRIINRAHDKPGRFDKLKGINDIDKIIEIDQSPIGKTPRSNPATYTGLFDEIRKVFSLAPEAKLRGYLPKRFSFNLKGGRCERCEGTGVRRIEMHFLPDVYVTCEECKGLRYNRETLEIKYKGLNIAEVLNLSMNEAASYFRNLPVVRDGIQTLIDVGLGYMALGQRSTTLSGGEAQRVKLASELRKKVTGNTIYILDEPTTGLHFHDIRKLLDVLQRLVNLGNTVIIIEHNLDVIKCADWIIDLGPEGGDNGGNIVIAGTPETVAACEKSYTGHYLARVLKQHDSPTPKIDVDNEDAEIGE